MSSRQSSAGGLLIVEDHPVLREILADMLRARGYAVATAATGDEALAQLKSTPVPALILLDLDMPDMQGWEFLDQKERDPALASIPLAGMSNTDTLLLRGYPRGTTDQLEKPVELSMLMELVTRYGVKQRVSGDG